MAEPGLLIGIGKFLSGYEQGRRTQEDRNRERIDQFARSAKYNLEISQDDSIHPSIRDTAGENALKDLEKYYDHLQMKTLSLPEAIGKAVGWTIPKGKRGKELIGEQLRKILGNKSNKLGQPAQKVTPQGQQYSLMGINTGNQINLSGLIQQQNYNQPFEVGRVTPNNVFWNTMTSSQAQPQAQATPTQVQNTGSISIPPAPVAQQQPVARAYPEMTPPPVTVTARTDRDEAIEALRAHIASYPQRLVEEQMRHDKYLSNDIQKTMAGQQARDLKLLEELERNRVARQHVGDTEGDAFERQQAQDDAERKRAEEWIRAGYEPFIEAARNRGDIGQAEAIEMQRDGQIAEHVYGVKGNYDDRRKYDDTYSIERTEDGNGYIVTRTNGFGVTESRRVPIAQLEPSAEILQETARYFYTENIPWVEAHKKALIENREDAVKRMDLQAIRAQGTAMTTLYEREAQKFAEQETAYNRKLRNIKEREEVIIPELVAQIEAKTTAGIAAEGGNRYLYEPSDEVKELQKILGNHRAQLINDKATIEGDATALASQAAIRDQYLHEVVRQNGITGGEHQVIEPNRQSGQDVYNLVAAVKQNGMTSEKAEKLLYEYMAMREQGVQFHPEQIDIIVGQLKNYLPADKVKLLDTAPAPVSTQGVVSTSTDAPVSTVDGKVPLPPGTVSVGARFVMVGTGDEVVLESPTLLKRSNGKEYSFDTADEMIVYISGLLQKGTLKVK